MKRPRESEVHDTLASLGYAFIPGSSGKPSDWVLRQLSAPTKGFEWSGQAHYDALGLAAVNWVRGAICGLCGLEPLGGCEPSTPYGTPGLLAHTGPLLILVCGSSPGGDAGVWVTPSRFQSGQSIPRSLRRVRVAHRVVPFASTRAAQKARCLSTACVPSHLAGRS